MCISVKCGAHHAKDRDRKEIPSFCLEERAQAEGQANCSWHHRESVSLGADLEFKNSLLHATMAR